MSIIPLRAADNTPNEQAKRLVYQLAEAVEGLQDIYAEHPDSVTQHHAAIAEEYSHLRALALHVTKLDEPRAHADDAIGLLQHAAAKVKQLLATHPDLVANRLNELNAAAYTLSGVITMLKHWRGLVAYLARGRR